MQCHAPNRCSSFLPLILEAVGLVKIVPQLQQTDRHEFEKCLMFRGEGDDSHASRVDLAGRGGPVDLLLGFELELGNELELSTALVVAVRGIFMPFKCLAVMTVG